MGVEYGPSVLISNYGVKVERVWDLAETSQTTAIYAECDGIYNGEVKVKLVVDETALASYNQANGTSYRVLPADCYSFDADSKTMTDGQVEFLVTYDVAKICALSADPYYKDIADYVIPFVLVSETAGLEVDTLDGVNLILVNPQMTHKTNNFHLVPPTSEDIEVTADSYVLKYKIATVEGNRYESDYDFSLEIAVKNGAVLAAGSDYSVTCSSADESFVSGVSEIVYTLTFPKKNFKPGTEWKLKAELTGVENGFVLDGDGVSNLTFAPYPALSKAEGAVPGFDRTRPKSDVCGNWLYGNRSGYALIDGTESDPQGDYWGWNWKGPAGDGGTNGNTYGYRPEDKAEYDKGNNLGAGHPYVFIFDLTANVDVLEVDLWRSGDSDGNWKALGAGYVEYSNDRETWGNKAEFDFTDQTKYPFDKSNLGPLAVPNAAPVSCKYIRLTLTRNWNSANDNNGAVDELDVYLSNPTLY